MSSLNLADCSNGEQSGDAPTVPNPAPAEEDIRPLRPGDKKPELLPSEIY